MNARAWSKSALAALTPRTTINADILTAGLRTNPLVYLDNAASSLTPRQVIDASSHAYSNEYANVHRGLHFLSNAATDAYEAAREKVRRFLNAPSIDEVIFTKSSTEAINTVAYGWGMKHIGEGDEIVLDGYFQEEPQPKSHPDAPDGLERMMAYLSQGLMKPRLHRWRFDLKTGKTTEQRLDDRDLEFGMINQKFAGRKNRYAYSAVPEPYWFLFTGLVKHDLETGSSEEIDFGPGRYGSESPFAPRIGATDEDDGYLVSFIADVENDRSECVLIDAKRFSEGPVCRIVLPERFCSGTHSVWANGDDIGMGPNTVLAA